MQVKRSSLIAEWFVTIVAPTKRAGAGVACFMQPLQGMGIFVSPQVYAALTLAVTFKPFRVGDGLGALAGMTRL